MSLPVTNFTSYDVMLDGLATDVKCQQKSNFRPKMTLPATYDLTVSRTQVYLHQPYQSGRSKPHFVLVCVLDITAVHQGCAHIAKLLVAGLRWSLGCDTQMVAALLGAVQWQSPWQAALTHWTTCRRC